jgi:rhodanese-related sulfurtransferase
VLNVEGGTMAWNQAGLPVTRGKKGMSLERQIRIVAGSLVFIGVVLGTLISPYFYGLSGFVGLGLIFAGVTDICPMAMVIARMPWNQVRDGAACSATTK